MRNKSPLDAEVLELVASGKAGTRAEVARLLHIAPSTASVIVSRLISSDILSEEGEQESTGGRRARRLVWRRTNDRSLVIELGVRHARLALVGRDGEVTHARSVPSNIADGPTEVLTMVLSHALTLAESEDAELCSVGVAVPGPVDSQSGIVIGPSRMPGWNNVNVAHLVHELTGLPAFVDNDARLGAMGELSFRLRHDTGEPIYDDYVYVKAGSAIGGTLVLGRKVHRGSFGLAGDLTHVPVAGGGNRPCRCGNRGCLDTVASAEALRGALGLTSNDTMLQAALDGNPQVVNAIRDAGVLLGGSLAHTVAFLNPQAVIVGGTLSAVNAFQAGIRQALHEHCLPATMEHLTVESSRAGRDAALWGLADQSTHSRS